MGELHFYSNKSKAKRAVVSQLGEDAVEGKDYHFVVNDERKVAYERLASPVKIPVKSSDPFAAIVAVAVIDTARKCVSQIKPPTYEGHSTKVVDGKKVSVEVTKVGVVKTATKKLSAKDHIRKCFARRGTWSIEEMMEGGYSEINLKTAMSDLKNLNYCGEDGPLVTKSEMKGAVRVYKLVK
jgi:hypothetical protein